MELERNMYIGNEEQEEVVIKVQHAMKSFDKNKVLNDVSVSCKRGHICGIV